MKHFGFLERDTNPLPPSRIRNYGAERDRTADLVIANHALFQLSYGPLKLEIEVLIFERAAESTNLGWESTGYGQARSLRRT